MELIEKIPIPRAEKAIHFGFTERAPLGAPSITSYMCSNSTRRPLPNTGNAVMLATVKYARHDPVAEAYRLTASFAVVLNPSGQVLLTEAVGGPDGVHVRHTTNNIRRETYH